MNYGMKVSQDGFDVGTCTDFDLVFSSKYDILKIGTSGTGSFTTGGTATIAHNFGYSPSYLLYLSDDGVNYSLYHSTGIGGVSSIGTDNLTITKPTGSVSNDYYMESGDDNCADYLGLTYFVGYGAAVGRGASYDINGGMRFLGVTETSSITKAELFLAIQYPSPRTGGVDVITKGIDEDNTANFSSSPFGRSQTSATVTNNCDNGITGVWSYEVTDIFKEIANRPGWSSGNAMGFLFFNNANDTNHYIQTYNDTSCFLRVSNVASPSTIYYKYVIFRNKLGTNTFP